MSKEPVKLIKRKDDTVELESQFVLRLPLAPAQELRSALRSGAANVKDRLSIQLENDMRHATVRFDNYVLPGKMLDLPCIIETHKTIDRKTFYKTADICQLLLCKEHEDDSQTTEEEDTTIKKKDKKDDKKVDKKFLNPHGITPPLKNVKKRRFRKTLKKKYVDAPEIEKEVKRLFRVDNEAVKVSWELISDADDTGAKGIKQLLGDSLAGSNVASPTASGVHFSNSQSLDIAEHDIFGEVVSSSEEEGEVNIIDSEDDESSRLSGGVPAQNSQVSIRDLVTEFTKGMIKNSSSPEQDRYDYSPVPHDIPRSKVNVEKSSLTKESQDVLQMKLVHLQQQLLDIQNQKQAQEQEIASIENQALKQRFQSILDSLIEEEMDKQRQYDEIMMMFQM